MNLYFGTFDTRFGAFSVAVDEQSSVVATAFGDRSALMSRIGACRLTEDIGRIQPARQQVLAYCAGQRRDFDLPLSPVGTTFQHRVWTALRDIPFGTTCSYGEVARNLGQPTASRAVGRANATNPICLITPCHRVIGANGSLTGFAFGEPLKRQLLEYERAIAASSRAA
jgi:methylated-DNA-[protein]-cysteine S-methyltransferase